jgi:retinol dehydrogenase-12
MLCRDIVAARAICAEISAAVDHAQVEALECDLASLESVRRVAHALHQREDVIGLLVNNAGIAPSRRLRSSEGYELAFAVNHLGPYLLTRLLLDRLTPGARVVNVASRIHFRARLSPARFAAGPFIFVPPLVYAQTKLANVLFTFALARRFAGSGITANCVHPGVINTNLLPSWVQRVKPLLRQHIIGVEEGARSTLRAALDADLAGVSGTYFDEYGVARPASTTARDVALQEALWAASARWAGLPD